MRCIICGSEFPDQEKNCPICGAAAPAGNVPYFGGDNNSYGQGNPPMDPFMQGSPRADLDTQKTPLVNPYAAGNPFMQENDRAETGNGRPLPAYSPVDSYQPYADLQPSKDAEGSGNRTDDVKKGTGKGLIIGIISGVLVIAALAVCFFLGLFHSKNGNYHWDDYARYGTTVQLKVDGDSGELTVNYSGKTETQKVELLFDGSEVTFSANGKYIQGTYDRKAQTISVEDESLMGFSIVLKKE